VTVRLDDQGILDFEPGNSTLRVTGSAGDAVDLHEAIGASGTDTWIKTDSNATVDTYTFTSSNAGNPDPDRRPPRDGAVAAAPLRARAAQCTFVRTVRRFAGAPMRSRTTAASSMPPSPTM
jgi:hypothetical protein